MDIWDLALLIVGLFDIYAGVSSITDGSKKFGALNLSIGVLAVMAVTIRLSYRLCCGL